MEGRRLRVVSSAKQRRARSGCSRRGCARWPRPAAPAAHEVRRGGPLAMAPSARSGAARTTKG
jgi:hypothetical protein